MDSITPASAAAPTITENENSKNFDIKRSNVERRLAWIIPSNDNDTVMRQVLEPFTWPTLSETNKCSSDSLTTMSIRSGSPSSDSFSFYQNDFDTDMLMCMEELLSSWINDFVSTKVAQRSQQSLSSFPESPSPYPFLREQDKTNEIASDSHGTQNQYQWNSYKNQNGNHHPHQSYGGRHRDQNFNRRGTPVFGRHGPPPPPPPPPPPSPMMPLLAPYMMPVHQPFYHLGAPLLYCLSPPCIPFMGPPVFHQVHEASLKARIKNQIHYYFSEENLKTDNFMRMRMNDEGFVHIQFIATFNKLKALTSNIQLILDALQGSNLVELKGYEIRSRHMWRKYLMPLHLRVPFDPTLENEVNSKVQNKSLQSKVDELGSSSRNKEGDN